MGIYDELNLRGLAASKKGPAKPRMQVGMGSGARVAAPPVVPKESLLNRGASAAGRGIARLAPAARLAGPLGAVAGLGTALFSDRDKVEEDRTFPIAGSVADAADEMSALRERQGEGNLAQLSEQFKAVPALAGGVVKDVYNKASNLYQDIFPPSEASSMQLTPEREEAQTYTPLPATLPARGTGSSLDQIIINQLAGGQARAPAPAPEVVANPNVVGPDNNSYFVNNESGVAPGEKQFFREMPKAFGDQPSQELAAPQAPGGIVNGRNGRGSDLPGIKSLTSQSSFGDIMKTRFDLFNQRVARLPGLEAQGKAASQRKQSNLDRGYNLDVAKFGQTSRAENERLRQGFERIQNTRGNSRLQNLIKIRGQDKRAAGQVDKPLTYKDQLEQRQSLAGLTDLMFPPGVASYAPDLVQQSGQSPEAVLDVYHQILAAQERVRPGEKLGEEELRNEMMSQLGITR